MTFKTGNNDAEQVPVLTLLCDLCAIHTDTGAQGVLLLMSDCTYTFIDKAFPGTKTAEVDPAEYEPCPEPNVGSISKTFLPLGESVRDPDSPWCNRKLFLCVSDGVVDTSACFVFDEDTKSFLEVTTMPGQVGEPLNPSDSNYKTVIGDVVICPTAADVSHDLATIQAAIVADGAMLGPDSAPVPYDPANPDHELVSLSAQSYYCGSDPCKTGVLVTAASACLVEASGETQALDQGGTESWNGSETAGPVEAGGTGEWPAGTAGRYCYTVRDTSVVVK